MSVVDRSDPEGLTPQDLRRWMIAALVSGAALLGTLILAVVIAFAIRPAAWVQIALGLGLVGVSVGLAWLVYKALGTPRS